MAGGKGKSSGGKSSGGKTSAAEGPKKQQSHSARAGLQVRSSPIVILHVTIPPQLRSCPRRLCTTTLCESSGKTRGVHHALELIPCLWASSYMEKHVDFTHQLSQHCSVRIFLDASRLKNESASSRDKKTAHHVICAALDTSDRSCRATLDSSAGHPTFTNWIAL